MKNKGNKSFSNYQFENFTPEKGPSQEQNNQWATLKDLCPEDKQKIGLLIQKLATAKDERQQLAQELKEKTKSYKRSLKKIKEDSSIVIEESKSTEQKFRQSLTLLKQYQQKLDLITQRRHEEPEKLLSEDKNEKENLIVQERPSAKLKETSIQTEEFMTGDVIPTIRPPLQQQQIYQNMENVVTQRNFDFLKKKQGESEQLLRGSTSRTQNPQISEYVTLSPQTNAYFVVNSPQKMSDIQKLKAEIEEITNGLKQMQFNQIEASFSINNQNDFQSQFQQFEEKSKKNRKAEESIIQKIQPLVQKKFEISDEESMLSSESDDVQLAQKILSQKKQKPTNKSSKDSLNHSKLTSQMNLEKQRPQVTPPSTKRVTEGQTDLERFNRQLDNKLQSMLGSSQSYNFSLSLTQQLSVTPMKDGQTQQMTTPADYLRSSQSKPQVTDKSKSSLQSTPQPIQDRPKIYMPQHDPAARCLFFKNTQQLEESKVKSLLQSQADEQELDTLIDSLNNKQLNRVFLYEEEESRPRQSQKRQFNYDQNLFDFIQKIESPKEPEQANKSLEYNEFLEKYHKVVDYYDD